MRPSCGCGNQVDLDRIKRVFHEVDPSGDGLLSLVQVSALIKEVLPGFTASEVEQLCAPLAQHAGRISFDEFADSLFTDGETSRDAAAEAKDIPQRRRTGSGRVGFQVNTVSCTGKSAKDLFSAVAAKLGWREVDVETRKISSPTIFCVMNTSDLLERLSALRRKDCWVTRYIGLPELCDKGNLAKMFLLCESLVNEEAFAFNPPTWVLPQQLDALRAVISNSNRTYIMKPEDGSQGDGICLVQGVRDLDVKLSIKNNKAAVVQEYVHKPLLLNGTKFDFRVYVCLIGGSSVAPPLVYLCREGLARFCTEVYNEPTQKNMHKCMGHLTNYSLNKRSDKFEHSGETLEDVFSIYSTSSKRPLTVALRQIAAEHPHFDAEAFYRGVSDMVRATVDVMSPAIVGYNRDRDPFGSFQVLGFDVLLDHRFKPYLLEVNNSPSLCIDECFPVDTVDAPDRKGVAYRRETQDKVCRCMDMLQPHKHRTSPVDLAVKTEAMVGVFQLLENLKEDAEPMHASYLAINVATDELFLTLQRVSTLFHQSGGAKAFTSSALRRSLGSLCGSGKLEKHDLDTLAQAFRASSFAQVDRSVGQASDAMRVFDYLSLLSRVSARAFPHANSRDALSQTLNAVCS